MRIQPPANDEVRKFGALLSRGDTLMLTTKAADGSLVSRPMGLKEIDSDGTLRFFTAIDSEKVDQITGSHQVNLSCAVPDAHTFVSIRGMAVVERDPARARELWTDAATAWFPDGAADPRLAILRVNVDDAQYWEGSQDLVSRAFALVREVLTGRQPSTPDEGRLEQLG